MELVARSSVPHATVLLYEEADLEEIASVLAVLNRSDVFLVQTVADTKDPLRAHESLHLVAQYTFADRPRADLLEIPGGYGAMNVVDDDLVQGYLRQAAADARIVLASGSGAVLAAIAKVEEGTKIAAPSWVQEWTTRRQMTLPLAADAEQSRGRKLWTARDAAGAVQAALDAIALVGSTEQAQNVAQELHIEWRPYAPPREVSP
jgi:cyclohexyl-isocyanide hydratase